MLNAALKEVNHENLRLHITDANGDKNENVLFDNLPNEHKSEKTIALLSAHTISIDNRIWFFEISTTKDYATNHRMLHSGTNIPASILLVGLFFTSFLAVISLVSSGRKAILEETVKLRTADLNKLTEQLQTVFNVSPIGYLFID